MMYSTYDVDMMYSTYDVHMMYSTYDVDMMYSTYDVHMTYSTYDVQHTQYLAGEICLGDLDEELEQFHGLVVKALHVTAEKRGGCKV